MPSCVNCGQPLKEDAQFCGQCGAAVRHCAKCGALLKEGAAFCGQCGASANEGSTDTGAGAPPSAPEAAPIGAQAPTSPAWVTFTLILSNYVDFFGGLTCTILVDGQLMRPIQMGETVAFAITPGQRTIELVQVFSTLKIPITRKANLQLTAVPGSQLVVTGQYSRFWGKFDLSLQQ